MSEEFGPNFITLTDEDSNDIELEYVDALELDGQTYMAFFPVVEDDADEEAAEEYGLVIPEVRDGKRRGASQHAGQRRGAGQGLRPVYGADPVRRGMSNFSPCR